MNGGSDRCKKHPKYHLVKLNMKQSKDNTNKKLSVEITSFDYNNNIITSFSSFSSFWNPSKPFVPKDVTDLLRGLSGQLSKSWVVLDEFVCCI
jgi:hypothetical protein